LCVGARRDRGDLTYVCEPQALGRAKLPLSRTPARPLDPSVRQDPHASGGSHGSAGASPSQRGSRAARQEPRPHKGASRAARQEPRPPEGASRAARQEPRPPEGAGKTHGEAGDSASRGSTVGDKPAKPAGPSETVAFSADPAVFATRLSGESIARTFRQT
jgi:hypothetical protein